MTHNTQKVARCVKCGGELAPTHRQRWAHGPSSTTLVAMRINGYRCVQCEETYEGREYIYPALSYPQMIVMRLNAFLERIGARPWSEDDRTITFKTRMYCGLCRWSDIISVPYRARWETLQCPACGECGGMSGDPDVRIIKVAVHAVRNV